MSEKSEYLPFHAINEFMRPDFRLTIIRELLTSQHTLPDELNRDLSQNIKRFVKVPGFRNSDKAPLLVKVVPLSKAFEKYPEIVATVLSCWAETQSELRNKIYHLLKLRNWPIYKDTQGIELTNLSTDLIKEWPVFPINFNRAKLPGFFTHWPKDEDFETLYKNFIELFPDVETSVDKVSLMVVWVSMRLPYIVDSAIKTEDN